MRSAQSKDGEKRAIFQRSGCSALRPGKERVWSEKAMSVTVGEREEAMLDPGKVSDEGYRRLNWRAESQTIMVKRELLEKGQR